ncbi:hypothetical protein BH09SUM1_BH09SUM1_21170 [soil metagenome]
MRKLSAIMLGAAILTAATAQAQVLSTTVTSDQFTTGNRGNATGTGNVGLGASKNDGTENALNTGAEILPAGGITYINSYAGASGTGGANDTANGESPVMNVTTIKQPDRNNLFSALTSPVTVPANTRPGAASGSDVLVISDDGGLNQISIGDDTSMDYFAQVDFFAIDRSADVGTPALYEACYLGVRSSRNGTTTDFSYSVDRDPSYYISYDYQTQTVKAAKAKLGNSSAQCVSRLASDLDGLYATQTAITSAWHTMRIEAIGTNVKFYLDGALIGTNAGDATPIANGRAALAYRESGVASANETAGVFDNFSAGPIAAFTAVSDWTTYN